MDKQYFLTRLAANKPSFLERYSYDLLPAEFNIRDELAIVCNIHGLFHQKAIGHLYSSGCPVCGRLSSSQHRTLTTDEFILKSKTKFGYKFQYPETVYTGADETLKLVCDLHGSFEITPSQHFRCRHGCPKCVTHIPRLIAREKMLELAKKRHGDKYDYSRINSVNIFDKVEIVCSKHGSFWQKLFNHGEKGCGCPNCAVENDRTSQENFISRSRAIHGDLYDYSKVVYRTANESVTIICRKHSDFVQRASSHLAGNGCLKCNIENQRLSLEKFIENARKVHGDRYDYSKVKYLGNKKPVEIICPIHGSFWQKPNGHVSIGVGCAFCSESKGEKAVELFLKKYGIDYIREYRIEGYRYRFDFYLPKFDIYIEFHGAQHYRPVKIFGGVPAFEEQQKRDKHKKQLVKLSRGFLVVLNYTSLENESVEKDLIRRLKNIYVRWYMVDGEIKVFRKLEKVCSEFDLPSTTSVSNIDSVLLEKMKNVKVLF